MNPKGPWNRLDPWFRLSRLSFPVPAHSKHLFYTLGGITFVGFIILFLTGLFLTQFFDPDPETALKSIRAVMKEVPGGRFIRSLHYWTAQAVVIALCLHLLRVFITGARQTEVPPEELTGTFTEHLRSIALFSLIYYGSVGALSVLIPAPLGQERLSHFTGEKPPWIYFWLYGLEHFTGIQGILYGSLALLILMLLIPLLDRGASRDPLERKGILATGMVAILVMGSFTLFAWLSPPEVHHGDGRHMEEPALPSHEREPGHAPGEHH